MESKTAAVIITQTEDGFTVLDAMGHVHEVADALELGELCEEVVNDPEMPQYETETAQVVAMEDMAVRVAETVLPEKFAFAAAPAVQTLRRGMEKLKELRVAQKVDRPVKIRSTPESQERARQKRADKNARKEEARKKAQERRRQGPRLSWRGA